MVPKCTSRTSKGHAAKACSALLIAATIQSERLPNAPPPTAVRNLAGPRQRMRARAQRTRSRAAAARPRAPRRPRGSPRRSRRAPPARRAPSRRRACPSRRRAGARRRRPPRPGRDEPTNNANKQTDCLRETHCAFSKVEFRKVRFHLLQWNPATGWGTRCTFWSQWEVPARTLHVLQPVGAIGISVYRRPM